MRKEPDCRKPSFCSQSQYSITLLSLYKRVEQSVRVNCEHRLCTCVLHSTVMITQYTIQRLSIPAKLSLLLLSQVMHRLKCLCLHLCIRTHTLALGASQTLQHDSIHTSSSQHHVAVGTPQVFHLTISKYGGNRPPTAPEATTVCGLLQYYYYGTTTVLQFENSNHESHYKM